MSFDRPTVPVVQRSPAEWGSDALAELLSRLDLPYLALNPGASYRGLHDSIVNYLGNVSPTMLLCLHEEHAVAVAHGYAKVTGRPMAVALHSNVGLMHGTMALFNAFCDRVPMVVIGATGPLDAAERRPWIDWIHTAADQGALIRNYVKWDDQPGSVAAALESLVRADRLTRAYPCAPTYVNLDASIQEQPLVEVPPQPDLQRFPPPSAPWPGGPDMDRAVEILQAAQRPAILVGRVSRSERAWAERIALAERLGARVLGDLKAGAGFPTAHPLAAGPPGTFLSTPAGAVLRDADCILSLDWIDLAGTIAQAAAGGAVTARVISVTVDHVLHNGWSKDHFALPAVDAHVATHPDAFVTEALSRLPDSSGRHGPAGASTNGHGGHRAASGSAAVPGSRAAEAGELTVRDLSAALGAALGERPATLVRLPLGFDGADLSVDHPLDYLGQDGGGGIGSGPGMAVGAALALRGTGRMPVAVLGDGDFMMGSGALWTASHYDLPLLVVVANNRSFFNDEVHQARVAVARGRAVENRWLGQQMRGPEIGLAAIAHGLGFQGLGPVNDGDGLAQALQTAVEYVAAGGRAVVDVHITQSEYPGGPAPARVHATTHSG